MVLSHLLLKMDEVPFGWWCSHLADCFQWPKIVTSLSFIQYLLVSPHLMHVSGHLRVHIQCLSYSVSTLGHQAGSISSRRKWLGCVRASSCYLVKARARWLQQLKEVTMVSVSWFSGHLDYPFRHLAAHSFLSCQQG